MKRKDLVIIFIAFLVNLLDGCAYRSKNTLQKQALMAPSEQEKKTKNFKAHIDVSVPIKLPDGTILEVQAEVSRPEKKIEPKTLFILVPGSGNVSRRGETAGDGVDLYVTPVEIYSLWSNILSENGFFVLSYDKRTCNANFNILCKKNPTKDIDDTGVKALAQDLDQIYDFAANKLASNNDRTKIILMTTTQGAQVVTQATCAKKADGIVLLSPIIGDLESVWVEGLMRAQREKNNTTLKNRLLNEAETTKGFFSSLKKNKFPDSAHVHGASIRFWRSWLLSSIDTVGALAALNKNILILLSANDVFSARESLINDPKYLQNKARFSVKIINQADRNFIYDGQVAYKARREIINFAKKLK